MYRIIDYTVLLQLHICTPKVFNREELQYGAYEMSVGDYWWGDDGGEVSEFGEVMV